MFLDNSFSNDKLFHFHTSSCKDRKNNWIPTVSNHTKISWTTTVRYFSPNEIQMTIHTQNLALQCNIWVLRSSLLTVICLQLKPIHIYKSYEVFNAFQNCSSPTISVFCKYVFVNPCEWNKMKKLSRDFECFYYDGNFNKYSPFGNALREMHLYHHRNHCTKNTSSH